VYPAPCLFVLGEVLLAAAELGRVVVPAAVADFGAELGVEELVVDDGGDDVVGDAGVVEDGVDADELVFFGPASELEGGAAPSGSSGAAGPPK